MQPLVQRSSASCWIIIVTRIYRSLSDVVSIIESTNILKFPTVFFIILDDVKNAALAAAGIGDIGLRHFIALETNDSQCTS